MVMSLHNAYLTMVTFLPGEAAWTESASLPRSFTGWKEDEGDWRKINWGKKRLQSRGENGLYISSGVHLLLVPPPQPIQLGY